ncbi:MAG: HNH endonuclease signature motif containing protein [Alphaproteobacteria bacterium]
MKGRPIQYSAEEMAWLEANRTLPISEYQAGFNSAFGREVPAANLHALRKRKGWKTGRTGHFAKGLEPHNKGKACAEGVGGRHPNARKTQFRKGQARSGVAAKVYKPIGTERMSKDGYLERKIHDGMPLQSRWRAVHLIEWEAVNGPIPEGHCLKSLDGNRLNTDPANWELIPRKLLPRLSGRYGMQYDDAEPEVRPTIMAVAKLKHAAKEVRCRSSAKPIPTQAAE